MSLFIEIFIILVLIIVQSIFGIGLLLFGTPSFLVLGYDFANTISILMPISITISALQFFKSKVSDRNYIKEYNLFCLPFLVLFLILALKFKHLLDFTILVAFLLIFSSILILNKHRFSNFEKSFFKLKKYLLIGIGCVHGLTNMGGSFLSIYATLSSRNIKEVGRYYISYGYLIMGVLQFMIVLFFSFNILELNKLYYVFLTVTIYFPAQKIFKNIKDRNFSKYINTIALIYGLSILISYY